ncbi:hypothetical protein [Micromonospora sp. NPDC005161]
MVDRIADPWGARTPYGPGQEWPVRVDPFLDSDRNEADVDRWVQSASVLHSNGDAMDIAVAGGRIVGVRGRAVDRVNRGRLDPKDLCGDTGRGQPPVWTRSVLYGARGRAGATFRPGRSAGTNGVPSRR